MQFDNLPTNPYLDIVLNIIRNGITQCIEKLNIADNEDIKNQLIADKLNALGTTNENLWLGVGKENETKGKQTREDIYFYLNDDNFTRIFYVECKRLPKYNTQDSEEYVIAANSSGNPSGGIQRFKKGIHGAPNRIFDNGLIAYVESKTANYWLKTVNYSIVVNYSKDEVLVEKENLIREYISLHQFDCESRADNFYLHHFWIDLSNK